MPRLIRNSDPSVSLCDQNEFNNISNYNLFFTSGLGGTNPPKFFRENNAVTSITEIKPNIDEFKKQQALLPADSPFKNLNLAMSVPVGDILNILGSEPNAKYIKFYNAFNLDDPNKRHTMFLLPADENNLPIDNPATCMVEDCCQCPPPKSCITRDKLTSED